MLLGSLRKIGKSVSLSLCVQSFALIMEMHKFSVEVLLCVGHAMNDVIEATVRLT